MVRKATFDKSRNLNLYARIGETGNILTLTFLNSDGTGFDISGKGFELPVKQRPNSTVNLFKLTEGSGLTVTGAENHKLQIELSAVNANQRRDVDFWTLYSSVEDHTWLNGSFTFHEGEFDGVEVTDTITIYENGESISITVSDGVEKYLSFNTQTDDYILALSDNFNVVETNKGTANTVTVPPNSDVAFPIGSQIIVLQYGEGQTTIAPGSGVTLRYAVGLKITAQYAGCVITKRSANEWYVEGSLGA